MLGLWHTNRLSVEFMCKIYLHTKLRKNGFVCHTVNAMQCMFYLNNGSVNCLGSGKGILNRHKQWRRRWQCHRRSSVCAIEWASNHENEWMNGGRTMIFPFACESSTILHPYLQSSNDASIVHENKKKTNHICWMQCTMLLLMWIPCWTQLFAYKSDAFYDP